MRSRAVVSVLMLGAGLFPVGEASGQGGRMPVPGYEETSRAVAACGVPAGNIRIGYEQQMQSDVVTISDLGGTDDARILCVKKAVHVAYIVMIGAEDQRSAFYAFDRVPQVSRSRRTVVRRQLGDIADKCGLPRQVLRLNGAGRIRFQPPPDSKYEAVDCALTQLDERGLSRHMPIGFIGNEAYSTETPR